jgi:diketogulonate reductase-like aldo/keto reductase
MIVVLQLVMLVASWALPKTQLLGGGNVASDDDVWMPFVGLGTGDHSPNAESECGFHCNLTAAWLGLGGSRLDGADSYGDEVGVAKGVAKAGAPRSATWITSKTGPGGYHFPLGYNDTLAQAAEILANYSTSYLDLLLIHGPVVATPFVVPPIDPLCIPGGSQFSETQCRLATWRAMLALWRGKKARAVGVSNFKVEHLEEIAAAGLPLPAVNQVSCSPGELPQLELLAWCEAHGVKLQAYHSFGGYAGGGSVLSLPLVVEIAAGHNRSPAEVVLNYQVSQGISVNPGFTGPGVPGYQPMSTVLAYMKENLGFFDFELTEAETAAIRGM